MYSVKSSNSIKDLNEGDGEDDTQLKEHESIPEAELIPAKSKGKNIY